MNGQWNTVYLPEICEIKTGKHDANHAVNNGKYRFYTCSSEFSMCDTTSFSGESVIVPGNGDIGLVFYYNGDFDAYQRTYVLNNIKINAKFLYYHMLHNWRSRNENKQFGSTIRYVRMSNFTNYTISFPASYEQQRIVDKIEELFSKLDKGVEELNKIKEQLKNYRQAVLKETLESNKPNHRVEDVVISFQNGIAKRSGKEGREILVLRLADVSNDSVIVSNDMRRILLSEEEQKTYVLDKDDAIIIRVNGSPDRVGRMILVDQGNAYAFCDHLIRCKFNEKIVLPKYVKYCMDASACRKYIKENMVSTAGQNTISQSTIKNCPIFVPNIKEQETLVKQIESRLSVCDKIAQTVNESLQKAESLRQSILKQAFEGKVV